ncbi:hypothetical protein EVAR_36829_1 [Eumeta japonica]|uniref:Uncharacterized protein n=1 Tax=Eumeta variegata TaxID=151549 RepID=A0A4C1WE40_EUMVA|nr:hypothetical protein EVAR_36829_1 [Eumeta japonica]
MTPNTRSESLAVTAQFETAHSQRRTKPNPLSDSYKAQVELQTRFQSVIFALVSAKSWRSQHPQCGVPFKPSSKSDVQDQKLDGLLHIPLSNFEKFSATLFQQ